MSAIQKQIDAAKYAKKIVNTVRVKVPADLREDVVRLVLAELTSPQVAEPSPETDGEESGQPNNPLEG